MRFLIALFLLVAVVSNASIDKNKVFVVANKAEPKSMELAQYYCKFRSIPTENIIALNVSTNKGIVSRKTFIDEIETPLFNELINKGAISAINLQTKDASGRNQLLLTNVNLDYLVLSKGIPWGISTRPPLSRTVNKPNTDEASVDSEISARFLSTKTYNGMLKNPAFATVGNEWRLYGLIRVARLDGFNYADVKKMLDNTMFVEQNGLRGRVYIDKSKYAKLGDKWLDASADILKKQGFDVSIDDSKALMSLGNRMDYPAVYFGWYSSKPSGYFAIPSYSAIGMIGWHIYSFSALSFQANNMWTSTLVAKGATCTDGNVFEPYLALTRNIAVFTKLMFEDNLLPAEAAFASLQALSWQNIYIGDPLYNPLKKTLQEQLDNLPQDALAQYSIIRKANLMLMQNDSQKAKAFLKAYIGKIPDTAIKWRLNELTENKQEKLEYAMSVANDISIEYVGLAFEACKQLEQYNKADIALKIYENIFHKYISNSQISQYAAIRADLVAKKLGVSVSPLVKNMIGKIKEQNRKAKEAKLKKQKTK